MPCLCYFETQNVISKWAGTPWTVSSRRKNKRPDCIERQRVGNKNRPNTLTRKQKKSGCGTNFSDLLRYERAQWLPMDLSWTGTGWNWDESTCLLNPKHFIWNICVLYEPFHFSPPLLAEMFAKFRKWRSNCMLPNCKDRTVGVTKSSSLRSLAELIQNKAKAKSINKYTMSYHISRSFISSPKVGKYLTSEIPKEENAVQWGKQ